MFCPMSLYAEVLRRQPWRKYCNAIFVLLCGPTTLAALLNSCRWLSHLAVESAPVKSGRFKCRKAELPSWRYSGKDQRKTRQASRRSIGIFLNPYHPIKLNRQRACRTLRYRHALPVRLSNMMKIKIGLSTREKESVREMVLEVYVNAQHWTGSQ